jgi:glycosyltransferase involved in cell wall biosynthesis
MKITATIITLNEERNIARAIESLRCCDEILIVDSGSVDRTVELAEKLGARVIEAGWRGSRRRRTGRRSRPPTTGFFRWTPTRRSSEALEAEIWNLKKSGPQFDAYTMPRLARYLGRWILHSGWYPDRKVRLYDRRKAKWVGDFVHESVQVRGARGAPGEQPPALHLRVAFRAPQDPGPLHHAGGAGTGRAQGEGAALSA